MKFLKYGKDGGKNSTVSGFWFLEIKSLVSIVILKFDQGSREVFHSHAFNALTWFISGEVDEHHIDGRILNWKPSIFPKFTPKDCFHKVFSKKTTFAFSIRGPWDKQWFEYSPIKNEVTTLQNGRKIINKQKV